MRLTKLISCRRVALDEVEVNSAENGELVMIIWIFKSVVTCNGFSIYVCTYRIKEIYLNLLFMRKQMEWHQSQMEHQNQMEQHHQCCYLERHQRHRRHQLHLR